MVTVSNVKVGPRIGNCKPYEISLHFVPLHILNTKENLGKVLPLEEYNIVAFLR